MSTEYERTAHSGTPTEDIPMSEREARASWQGDRDDTENDHVTSESETGLADHDASKANTESGRASTTDVDIEPEQVSTTEYGAEHATATEYGAEPERATTANAGGDGATTADYEAQPAETATADYDYDAQPTATHTADADRSATASGAAAADQETAASGTADAHHETGMTGAADAHQETAVTGDADADQFPPATTDATPDQSATSGNGVEPQQASLDDVSAPLFADTDLDQLRTQWREVQGTFVDNPREAVTQADRIVTDIIYQLTTAIAERKRVLEERTSGVQDADTEDLRQALRGYRGFFRRLLSIES